MTDAPALSLPLALRLIDILKRSSEGAIDLAPGDSGKPLRDLGLTSITILNFLVSIEDELAIEWSPDTPRETFRTLDTIADALRTSYGVDA